MNKLKLQAKLIDMGVVEEESVVVIKEANGSLYVTVVSGLSNTVTYIWMNGVLTLIEGYCHVSNIEKLKELEVEKF